jgi:hypothetical protein
MLGVKTLRPAISIEGVEDATDSAVAGYYQKVIRREHLKAKGSVRFFLCYTSMNYDVIGSERTSIRCQMGQVRLVLHLHAGRQGAVPN